MATRGRNILKNWFKRGDKPLAVQFADWIDSFWHKTEDKIPMSSIENLNSALNQKANQVALNAHVTDINNPHSVTASQIGAATPTDLQGLQTQITQNIGDIEVINVEMGGIKQELAEKEHFRGYYSTTAEIQALTNSNNGDYAYNAETGTKWAYAADTWSDTGTAVPDQVVPKGTTVPKMDGVASVGINEAYAADDHIHPTDITRASKSELDQFINQTNAAIEARQKNAEIVNFITSGETRGDIMTFDKFIAFLLQYGAFDKSSWTAKGSFETNNNQILDTASVGKIDLAGCSIYVESDAYFADGWYINGYTIRILSVRGDVNDGTEANCLYIYTKYANQSGVWRKFTTQNSVVAEINNSINLLAVSKSTPNCLINHLTGVTEANFSHQASDFIDVSNYQQITFSNNLNRDFYYPRLVFYDANKAYISGMLYNSTLANASTVDIPTGAAYIRFSADCRAQYTPFDTIKIEAGNMSTKWTLSPYDMLTTSKGEWLPVVRGRTTEGTVSNYSIRLGTYLRIGNIVTVMCRLTGVYSGAVGTLMISGLPFPVKNTPGYGYPVSGYIGYQTGNVTFILNPGTDYFESRKPDGINNPMATAVIGTDLSNTNFQAFLTATYETDY